jgi:hypothetical protein
VAHPIAVMAPEREGEIRRSRHEGERGERGHPLPSGPAPGDDQGGEAESRQAMPHRRHGGEIIATRTRHRASPAASPRDFPNPCPNWLRSHRSTDFGYEAGLWRCSRGAIRWHDRRRPLQWVSKLAGEFGAASLAASTRRRSPSHPRSAEDRRSERGWRRSSTGGSHLSACSGVFPLGGVTAVTLPVRSRLVRQPGDGSRLQSAVSRSGARRIRLTSRNQGV